MTLSQAKETLEAIGLLDQVTDDLIEATTVILERLEGLPDVPIVPIAPVAPMPQPLWHDDLEDICDCANCRLRRNCEPL